MSSRSVSCWIALAALLVGVAGVSADPYADDVVSFSPGPDASFGHSDLPEIVLGPPVGNGDVSGGIDVASLGNGGSIVLEFVDNRIIDGPGVDFTVFENAFFMGLDPLNVFAETARVSVSQNGVDWFTFEPDYNAAAVLPENIWRNLAGVRPVYADLNAGVSPLDPAVSGGDSFDLAEVGLAWASYILLEDTGLIGTDSAMRDVDGDIIEDRGGFFGGAAGGFDLDAVAAVNSEDLGAATPTPTLTPTMTPTPPPTATPDVSPTPTPVGPFDPVGLQVTADFVDRDMRVGLRVYNSLFFDYDVQVYLLVELQGLFFFLPSYGATAEPFLEFRLPGGADVGPVEVVRLSFPDPLAAPVELTWHAGLLDVEDGVFLGEISSSPVTIGP